MRVLDLFSGVGMYALGSEQAGHDVIGFCENEKWCHKILKKHYRTKPISWSIQLLNRALMSSRAASRAKISPPLINPDKVSMESVRDSSGRCCEPFAWYDQSTLCWRTFQTSLEGGYSEYSGAWPASGMILSGIAYQRQAQAHHTNENGFTWLPTIGAQEGRGSSQKRYRGSQSFRGAKMSEGLRTCEEDPIYLNPSFGELAMGLDKGYTELETETPRVYLEK